MIAGVNTPALRRRRFLFTRSDSELISRWIFYPPTTTNKRVKSLVDFEENQEIVDRYSKNWDVERVVFMDSLILNIAIVELTQFDSIPVKVTLDEWIDIAKYYSSPTSSNFVNGVLDKIVADFIAEGKIQKSGRGLL